MMLDTPDCVELVYPQHCVNCPHRENCAKLKVNDTCYAVDVEIRKENVKYEIMEGIAVAYRKQQSDLPISADLLHTETA